jgi:hypothetical protein
MPSKLPALRFLPFLLTLALPLAAQEAGGADSGVIPSTDLSLQTSTRPEAKLSLTQSFTFPLLRGAGPLTRGNNLKTALSLEISPISLNGVTEITWTPIAFFQLAAGGRIGSGWNISLGSGIGVNELQSGGTGKIRGEPFEGLYWGVHGGAVLQFDLAALFPGDWNHLVLRSYHEARYRAFTGAAAGESWVFESDDGENRNGWSYYGNCLLGYQMPASPVLNTVGILAEVDQYLYNTPGGGAWGDDLPRWYLGVLFNLNLSDRLSLAVLAQLRTRRNYGSSDLENQDRRFYQTLTLDKDDPYRLMFYRAAAVFSYRLL